MMKKFILRYSKEAERGFLKLEEEGSETDLEDFWSNIDRLKRFGIFGKPLLNKDGRNLENNFKIYFGERRWRIVVANNDDILDIIDIIAIGKRENFEVYDTANQVLIEKEKKDA